MATTKQHVHVFVPTVIVLISCLQLIFCAKILILGPLNRGRGHTCLLSALGSQLASKGHRVVILVPSDTYLNIGSKFDVRGIEKLKYSTLPYEESDLAKSIRAGNFSRVGGADSLRMFKEVIAEQVHYCRQILSNTLILTKLREDRFDLIIADMFNGCEVLLPEVLQVQFIALTSGMQFPYMNYNVLGFPNHEFWSILTLASPISFRIRFKICLRNWGIKITTSLLASSFTELQREFNISPEENMHSLANKVQFWLSQDFSLLENPHPTMPNWSPVGGLAAARPGNLTMDLKAFVDESGDDGFIVLSVGSIVGGFNSDMAESIALVLSKLPCRVIWKQQQTTLKNLGSNTKVLPWLPQGALLAHPKARLLIGHGGLNGIFEAIYNAVPMILIPQMLDEQYYHALRVERLGFGVILEKSVYSPELLETKIKHVLSNTSFRDKVSKWSKILRDDDPMDRAVYWVEHILKFGGSHLRPQVYSLNFIQYYLLDVYALCIGIVFFAVLVLYYTCSFCCRRCKRPSIVDSSKSDIWYSDGQG